MTIVQTDDALCLDCNYPLRGLTMPRCPECGREFDPNDPWTINTGRPLVRAMRWLLRPPGRWTVVGAVIAAALIVSDGKPAPTPLSLTPIGLAAWTILGTAWVARSTVQRLVARLYRQPLRFDPAALRRKRVAQWLFVVSVFCIYTGLPSYVRFLVLRPALERVAIVQLTAPTGGPPIIGGGRLCPHAVWFDNGDRQIGLGPSRFGYSPEGPCRNNGKTLHLFGAWYVAFDDH